MNLEDVNFAHTKEKGYLQVVLLVTLRPVSGLISGQNHYQPSV